MTICIAALCDDKKKIVIASDRMVTVGSVIEFEHDVKKFVDLTQNCVAMTAGSATVQNDILESAKKEIELSSKPVFNQVINKLKEEYVKFRTKRAEELHLKPKGLNFQTFYQSQQALQPEIVYGIINSIENTNLGVEFITCGFDEKGGHIQYITDPGISESFDGVGFCAIGSGHLNAISSFTAHNYAPSSELNEALYLVYAAKKEAERAPGVGDNDTDIAIIFEKGIYFLTQNEKEILEKVYEDAKKIEEKEYKDVQTLIIDKWGVNNELPKETEKTGNGKEGLFGNLRSEIKNV
jgi:20S proteasome alpha/beta subunit